MIDLTSKEVRVQLVKEIKSDENQSRKREAFIQYDVFKDNQHRYVIEYLKSQFSDNTVKEMPVVSSINLSKRIVTQEASVYKTEPGRTFEGLTEQQSSQVEQMYTDSSVNSKLLKSNQLLKLQGQTLLYVVPMDGGLVVKNLLPYQVDVIPNGMNPEIADGYIISAFDRQNLNYTQSYPKQNAPYPSYVYPGTGTYSDGVNNAIGDSDDYLLKERYVVWTKELNFIMDGKGNILSEDPTNPIGMLPFVDVYHEKDMEYWVRLGQAVTDFSIQFNASLSDLANVVRMQGWGQAWLKGPKELLPESIVVGVNKILKLPTDVNTNTSTEFGFSTPSPDLQGSISFIETLLAMFMSSRGVDPKAVSGNADSSRTYSSGIERLLSLVEKFEASKEDYSLFKKVEYKLFEIFKRYINVYGGTDVMPSWTYGTISDSSYVYCEYEKPEMIQTELEKLDVIQKRTDLGIVSKVEAIMMDRGIERDQAKSVLEEIEGEYNGSQGIDRNTIEDESETES